MSLRDVAPLVASALLASCTVIGGSGRAETADCSTITAENTGDCVRLNQIQVLGTHNSYHLAPEPPMLAALGPRARDIEYSHRPLTEQLSALGVRKFELDVFADPEGGRFAEPAAFRMVKAWPRSIDGFANQDSRCCILRTSTTERPAAP
jgi:hypothetical protein